MLWQTSCCLRLSQHLATASGRLHLPQWAPAMHNSSSSHWQGWVSHHQVAPLVLPWVNPSACVIRRDLPQTSSHCNWCAEWGGNLLMPLASLVWSCSLPSLPSAAPSLTELEELSSAATLPFHLSRLLLPQLLFTLFFLCLAAKWLNPVQPPGRDRL